MRNIIIFGAPGSGKGTYSKVLAQKFGYQHISTGDLLRKQVEAQTQLGVIASDYIKRGALIPDKLILDILAREYDAIHGKVPGVLFDGFPRTIVQAKTLKSLLCVRNELITMTVNLVVPEYILMERLLERAKLEGRADDNEETIKQRFKVYQTQTYPLIEWFRQEGVLSEFTYKGSKEQIIDEIVSKVASL